MVIMRPPHRRAPKPPPTALGIAGSRVAPVLRSPDVENLDPQAARPRKAPPRKRDVAEAVAGARARAKKQAEQRLRERNNLWLHGRRRRRRKRIDAPIVPVVAEGPAPAPALRTAPEARAPPACARASRASQSKPATRVSSQSSRLKEAPGRSSQSSRLKEAPLPLSPQAIKKRPFTPKPPPPPPETVRKDTAMALPGGGTNCAYWERVAADYDCEIMDTLSEDKGKVLRRRLRDCCRKLRKTKGGILALDAGCGAGKWLPFLGSLVDDLLAIDCSQKLVERAKRVYGSPGRVTATGRPRAPCRFGVVDLTKDEPGEVERHDLVVSANVLIAPDRAVCEAILAATLGRVANGGYLVLLVPSHESARAVANVYMRHRLPQKKKLGRSDRHRDFTPLNAPEVEAQVWKRWGVRTQTYSLGALRGLLNVEGYDVERIQRVEYDWDTELDIKPPKAVARPFDWLAVVRRRD
jgi:SAM-dependent methyltransferase